MKKRLLSVFLALVLCLGMCVPAFAAVEAVYTLAPYVQTDESWLKVSIDGTEESTVKEGLEASFRRFYLEDVPFGSNDYIYRREAEANSVVNTNVVFGDKQDFSDFQYNELKPGTEILLEYVEPAKDYMMLTAYSDPDGDGIFDEQLMMWEEANRYSTLDKCTLAPLTDDGPFHCVAGTNWYDSYLRLNRPGFSGSKRFAADDLYAVFGPNTLIEISDEFKTKQYWFHISADWDADAAGAAMIGTMIYPTLQAAVDAVSDGGYIDIISKEPLTATVNRAVKFTVRPGAELIDNVKNVTIKAGSGYSIAIDAQDNDAVRIYRISQDTAGGDRFQDVPDGHWAGTAVTWAVGKEITKGTGDNKFSPDDKCKGTEILTFLFRASGETAPAAASPFTVASYYQDAVNWAWSKGFIDSSFVPDAPCTRASAVKFIWLALNGGSAPSGGFADVPANADYAAAVDWAASVGITNGYGNNEFRPGNTCSRGEIVTFLHRAYVPSVRLK